MHVRTLSPQYCRHKFERLFDQKLNLLFFKHHIVYQKKISASGQKDNAHAEFKPYPLHRYGYLLNKTNLVFLQWHNLYIFVGLNRFNGYKIKVWNVPNYYELCLEFPLISFDIRLEAKYVTDFYVIIMRIFFLFKLLVIN